MAAELVRKSCCRVFVQQAVSEADFLSSDFLSEDFLSDDFMSGDFWSVAQNIVATQ